MSTTAARFDISVSGASRTLDKLREQFSDPLLTTINGRLQPTVFGLSIIGNLRTIVGEMGSLTKVNVFDPKTSRRTFRVASFSAAASSLLAYLVKRLHKEAPGVRIAFSGMHQRVTQALLSGDIDFSIAPSTGMPEGLHCYPLFELKRAIVLREEHPLLPELSRRHLNWEYVLSRYPLVSIARFSERDLPSMDTGLSRESLMTRSTLQIYNASVALGVLKETDAVLVCGLRGAKYLKKVAPWLVAVPINDKEITNPTLLLSWSEATHKDPGCIWLRGLIKEWAKSKE